MWTSYEPLTTKAPGAADRRRGFGTAMKRHGLADRARILPGGPTEEDGATVARALLHTEPRPACLAHIGLTSVGQDIPRLTNLAVGRALARLEDDAGAGEEIVVLPHLVTRSTTAAPRDAG